MARPLDGRIALVTGASRGIGHAVALELTRAGAHVIALARTQGAPEELDDAIRCAGSEATLVPCDLKDFDTLDRLGAAIFERWGRLDILIANAGILGPFTPLAHIEPMQWEEVFAINVTANWRLIRSLDLPLRRAEAGRVMIEALLELLEESEGEVFAWQAGLVSRFGRGAPLLVKLFGAGDLAPQFQRGEAKLIVAAMHQDRALPLRAGEDIGDPVPLGALVEHGEFLALLLPDAA